ncbi:MAG: hypothetical protein Q9221_002992 [Calogaya cf. arnoldii]
MSALQMSAPQMSAPQTPPKVPLSITTPSTPTSAEPPETSPSPSLLTPPSISPPLENPPPSTPLSSTSTTSSTETTDSENFGSFEDDYHLMTTKTLTLLSNILATTQAQRKLAQSLIRPSKPASNNDNNNNNISESPQKSNAPQASELEPLWCNTTLGNLIGRLLEAKNLTRGDVGNEDRKYTRMREVEQVRLLRGLIAELVEFDREVLGARELVLGAPGEGREGVVKIFVTPPEKNE